MIPSIFWKSLFTLKRFLRISESDTIQIENLWMFLRRQRIMAIKEDWCIQNLPNLLGNQEHIHKFWRSWLKQHGFICCFHIRGAIQWKLLLVIQLLSQMVSQDTSMWKYERSVHYSLLNVVEIKQEKAIKEEFYKMNVEKHLPSGEK